MKEVKWLSDEGSHYCWINAVLLNSGVDSDTIVAILRRCVGQFDNDQVKLKKHQVLFNNALGIEQTNDVIQKFDRYIQFELLKLEGNY